MTAASTGASGGWIPPSLEELQQLLPQYEIESVLGQGGMGAVYKGKQVTLHRPVAIKVLPENLIADDNDHQYVERFKLEARAMANLDHPAIISVYDFGQTTAGHLYFVMEFIDGMDIEQYIAASGGKVEPEHAIAIVSHVLDALDFAHSQGIVHRDIKPANVLINATGRVKIADFGLAKQFGGEAAELSGLTMTNMAMGTPDYIAPEALEIGRTPDHRADLYAVGVMLYRMLTGKLPRGMFKMPSEEIPGMDERFDEIIAAAMESDPESRYHHATQFREKLDELLTKPITRIEPGQDTTAVSAPGKSLKGARTGPSRVQSNTAARRSESGTGIAIGVASCLIIGVIIFLLSRGGGEEESVAESDATDSTTIATPSNGSKQETEKVGNPATLSAKSPPGASSDSGKPLPTTTAESETGVQASKSTSVLPLDEPPKDVAATSPAPPESISLTSSPPPSAEESTKPTPESSSSLPAISSPLLAIPGLKIRLEGYLKTRNTQVAELATRYQSGLKSRRGKAVNAGDLDLVEAFQEEQTAIIAFQDALAEVPADLVEAVEEPERLASLPEKAPEELIKLRTVWTTERKKIRSSLSVDLDQSLKNLETNLTRTNKIDLARLVRTYRGSLDISTPPPVAPAESRTSFSSNRVTLDLDSISRDTPFENSLGMKFLPVEGADILMCIHEARKMDYEAYDNENNSVDDGWKNPSFDGIPLSDEPDHPVVMVSYRDAEKFCEWLSEREGLSYRLPTEHEWNLAFVFGVPNAVELSETDLLATVMGRPNWEKGEAMDNGNFAQGNRDSIAKDGFKGTAPVMHFDPNRQGFYDMAGNAWEWCTGVNESGDFQAISRGPGLFNYAGVLKTPRRNSEHPDTRHPEQRRFPPIIFGFRCVISLSSDSAVTTADE